MMDQLKPAHGQEFDKQFLNMMVEGHSKALEFLGQAQDKVQDPAVVKLIGQHHADPRAAQEDGRAAPGEGERRARAGPAVVHAE